ncbi:selenium-binding family protein [Thermomicrobiaceae bacterium CFH 74404]|uniref:Methanethiol oxidase n=1 Tax=Thermalbibacter longus TaxID=2951981 RepID=A0AA41WHC8_9BACT|nr:selenium-binding family protein [Thermalbibacter longus]MCM8750133.1 selenium-binding family protein [Thermalbibacter longus]
MAVWRPDPTFYPSPRSAMKAPPEELAFVVRINPNGDSRPDAICVVDVNPQSSTYGQVVGEVEMTHAGDELHHFGWNACSSMLCPNAPHPHVERRYLVVPALGSSRIYIVDTKPDPTRPKIVKVIEPEEVADRAGYAKGHTVHCGPDGIYISALGAPDGDGPGGIFILDHDSFDVLGRWEIDRGDQYLHYDFWWHLGYDTMVTSEWGTPKMVENGVQGDLLLEGQYGHRLHFWDLRRRRHVQTIDLGKEHQIALELRPAHDPTKSYGFVNTVVSLNDLSSSIWVWYRKNGSWDVRKVIDIPAEPAEEDQLPDILKPFKAVPPLVTDIDLSVDDRFLYVSCWGTGELRQYDVSDPFNPKLTGSVHIGGIVRRAGHPAAPGPLNGGPQMVEVSRDGRRVYFTNSLYLPWDAQFYPDGIRGWMVKLDVNPEGGISFDPNFFLDFGDQRAHQIRLQGGDASTDSYCFP